MVKNNQKIILTVGLPGSGKTFWAKEKTLQDGTCKIVCKDDLRAMSNAGKHRGESVILAMRDSLIDTYLKLGLNVIVADCNLNPIHEKNIREKFGARAIIEIESFTDVSLDVCLERDRKRPTPVGAKVIRGMYNQYLRKIETYVPDPSLPPAVIFDVDGTLAKMVDRGPFEWDKVGQDAVHEYVASQLRNYFVDNITVIILSGRDGCCRAQTEEWLKKNHLPHHLLLMRPGCNNEKDCIVKKKLFDDHIKDRYKVLAVYDDRPQVCRMWFQMGLPLFKVGDPDAEF